MMVEAATPFLSLILRNPNKRIFGLPFLPGRGKNIQTASEGVFGMDEHVRFISYAGKQILLIDFTDCPAAKTEEIARTVPDVVMLQAPHSVLILGDFTRASLNEEAIRAIEEAMVFDKFYVKKAALAGTEHLPGTFVRDISMFSRREFPVFKSRLEALQWLTQE